jgi:uncharacterized protein YbbC (DUF1343 family)
MTGMVRTGCDLLRAGGFELPGGAAVGLLANQASVSSSLEHVSTVIMESDARLECIFGPQHGPFGVTQANMVEWEGYADPRLGIPVYSLYGETRVPSPAMLAGLDLVVIDLQDVGARPYTYIWTAVLMMRACAASGIRVAVLDRPNPLGGLAVEGPVLEKGFESFVGLWPLAMRHGMTTGEILAAINGSAAVPCSLEIIKMVGWKREMLFGDTGLPWVLPSPNMPTPETAMVYPGAVLLEGTNISEGRGTTRPFELVGAPWIDGYRLAGELSAAGLTGAAFRPAAFRPTFDKYAGEDCGGVQIHVTDAALFQPVLCGTAVILAVAGLYPGDFSWLEPPYEYETGKPPIDVIYGGAGLREAADRGMSAFETASLGDTALVDFLRMRERYLLY